MPGLFVRFVVAGCLVVEGVIHLRMLGTYRPARSDGLGQGDLFVIVAVAAFIVALWVLVAAGRAAYVVAFLVTAGACAAVLLYRYVDVPAFGPIPSMYDPVWFGQKALSVGAEGVGAVLALFGATTSREP